MQDIVQQWYEQKKNVDEMVHWEQGKLKKWEADVVRTLPRGARVLDIGCGMGREAFALSDMGFAVTGIDISREVIRQVTQSAREQGRGIPFLWYNGHHLPFDDASFDAALIWAQTFGLLYGGAYKREMLGECRRVLAPGGTLSFSGHDADYLAVHHPKCLNQGRFYPYANADIHWETFRETDLRAYAKDAGFTVTYCGVGEIYQPEDGTILHCVCINGKQ